jgi:hypothetical protein
MNEAEILSGWRADGFVMLNGYLSAADLAPAVAELGTMFPSGGGFHDHGDPRYSRYLADEFDGIDLFPFASVEVSLLAVHDRLIRLAELLLSGTDVRISSAEAWAKYTGAADYDQNLHRDYLGHTVLVPTTEPDWQQVEMFVYLCDVPEQLGPPHLVSRVHTADLPVIPNWYPRADGADPEGGYVSATGRPDLYAAEQSGAGPAGTVIAFTPATVHRGTALTAPRGARYSMQMSYRAASAEWGQRRGWADHSHDPGWYQFVSRANPRQLRLFGFPPPGHPFWTAATVSAMRLRYPDTDWAAWHQSNQFTSE